MSTFWSAKCWCDLQFLDKWTEGGLHRKHLGHDPSYSMRSQPNLSVYIMDQWLHNYLMIQVKSIYTYRVSGLGVRQTLSITKMTP